MCECEVLSCVATRVEQDTMLNKISQEQKDKHSPHLWKPKMSLKTKKNLISKMGK